MTRDSQRIFISGIQDVALGPLLELKLQISHYRQKSYTAVFKDFDSQDDAHSTFQNIMAKKEIDMIILFVKQEAKSKDFLLTEANRIKQSGSYRLVQENFYQEPFPVQLIFFKKI